MVLRETQLLGMEKLIINMHIRAYICFLQLGFLPMKFY